MIDVSVITAQMVDWLKDDADLRDASISRSEVVNEDANLAVNGWIGIYRRSVEYSPRNLGLPTDNYEGIVNVNILAQQTHLGSGEQTEDALEALVKKILDRMIQIPKTYIDMITSATVEYAYIESDRKTLYFQGALISLEMKVTIEVG